MIISQLTTALVASGFPEKYCDELMISAIENPDANQRLIVRCQCYLPALEEPPTVTLATEGKTLPTHAGDIRVRELSVKTIPLTDQGPFDLWTITIDYAVEKGEESVDAIFGVINTGDPETPRGTVTTAKWI